MEVALIKTVSNSVRFSAKLNSKYFPRMKKYADNNIKYKVFDPTIFAFLNNLGQDLEHCHNKYVVKNDIEAYHFYNALSTFHHNMINTGDCNCDDVIIVRYYIDI